MATGFVVRIINFFGAAQLYTENGQVAIFASSEAAEGCATQVREQFESLGATRCGIEVLPAHGQSISVPAISVRVLRKLIGLNGEHGQQTAWVLENGMGRVVRSDRDRPAGFELGVLVPTLASGAAMSMADFIHILARHGLTLSDVTDAITGQSSS